NYMQLPSSNFFQKTFLLQFFHLTAQLDHRVENNRLLRPFRNLAPKDPLKEFRKSDPSNTFPKKLFALVLHCLRRPRPFFSSWRSNLPVPAELSGSMLTQISTVAQPATR